jgi:hypothetical protein
MMLKLLKSSQTYPNSSQTYPNYSQFNQFCPKFISNSQWHKCSVYKQYIRAYRQLTAYRHYIYHKQLHKCSSFQIGIIGSNRNPKTSIIGSGICSTSQYSHHMQHLKSKIPKISTTLSRVRQNHKPGKRRVRWSSVRQRDLGRCRDNM